MDIPAQQQSVQPGSESTMTPHPQYLPAGYTPSNKLAGKVALITGGDSGIGRAVAALFAWEGCQVGLAYLNEHQDAQETADAVRRFGQRAQLFPGDLTDSDHAHQVVQSTFDHFGSLDIVVNNAAVQYPQAGVEEISDHQLFKTFATNIFSYFYITRAAVPLIKQGSRIINTTSVTAYRGSNHLIDYASTKGAIVAFTRSLAQSLAPKGILVNGVAPGPVWTPLIPASFSAQEVEQFGKDVLLGRVGQPAEIAPSYLFLAAPDNSYMTGQILHPNGGEIHNT